MPFVKRDVPAPAAAAPGEFTGHVAALSSADAESRWRAARALAGVPQAVLALAAALAGEKAARVQEAIMTALVRIGDEASVRALLPYLRSPDAALRAAAVEALQALPQAVAPFMGELLADDDFDLRIMAVELVRNMPSDEITRLLSSLLEREQHPNVCAAAVDVLAEVGTPEALPALRQCAERFAGTPFLPFAVSVAIARISGTQG